MAFDQTKTRRTNWHWTLNTTDMGGLDSVDLSGLKPDLDPVVIGTAGKAPVDARFVGFKEGSVVKIQFRETKTWNNMKLLFPWLGAGTDLVPPDNTLISTYAQQSIFHPVDQGATTTEDIVLYKTVPVQGYTIKRDGMKDDVFEVELLVLPDPTKVGTSASKYGKVGAAA